MDIISLMEAKKARKRIRELHQEKIGLDVERQYKSLDSRLDYLEDTINNMRHEELLTFNNSIAAETRFSEGTHHDTEIYSNQIRLKKSGSYYVNTGYWLSKVIDVTSGFEEIVDITKTETVGALHNVRYWFRASNSPDLEAETFHLIDESSVFRKYVQIKIELTSTDYAPATKKTYNFGNVKDEDGNFVQEANNFEDNLLVKFDTNKTELATEVIVPMELSEEYEGEGFVYSRKFKTNEFKKILGLDVY